MTGLKTMAAAARTSGTSSPVGVGLEPRRHRLLQRREAAETGLLADPGGARARASVVLRALDAVAEYACFFFDG